MLGSSPRVWGQVSDKPPSVCTKRIIPTRVGTRGDRENGSTRYEDHPHACGDYYNGEETNITLFNKFMRNLSVLERAEKIPAYDEKSNPVFIQENESRISCKGTGDFCAAAFAARE